MSDEIKTITNKWNRNINFFGRPLVKGAKVNIADHPSWLSITRTTFFKEMVRLKRVAVTTKAQPEKAGAKVKPKPEKPAGESKA